MANCIMLERTVIAPTAISPPYFSREELKQTASRLSVDCMINGESPRARLGRNTLGTSFISVFRKRHLVCFPRRNRSTQSMDTAWEQMVASAAPFTPICSPKIRMGSRTIFSPAPISTVFILTVVKP